MELKRNLDLTITLRDEEFSIDITEPESGEVISMTHYYAFDEHPSFNEDIGNEIYSWLSLWKDEQEESCVANEMTTPDEVVESVDRVYVDKYDQLAKEVIDFLAQKDINQWDWVSIKEYVDRMLGRQKIVPVIE